MNMNTRVSELLGTEYPIVEGGMQWIGTTDLAAAVSNAGALGMLTARLHDDPDHLRSEVERLNTLTDRPFGVNLSLPRHTRKYDNEQWVDAIVDSGVRIVETAGNSPAEVLPRLKENGITVIHKVTSIRHALAAEKMGVDIISMDGFEAAGRPGEDDVPLMVLLPAAVRQLDLPVIASGGIADGRGIAAAFALGADGVNIGTRFVLTEESPLHPTLKTELLGASELDTVLIMRSLKATGRYLRNGVTDAVLAAEEASPGDFAAIRDLVAGSRGRQALLEGDRDGGLICVSQAIGLIDDVPPVSELIRRMIMEADALEGTH